MSELSVMWGQGKFFGSQAVTGSMRQMGMLWNIHNLNILFVSSKTTKTFYSHKKGKKT